MPQAIPAIAKMIANAAVYITGSGAVGNAVYVVATAALYAAPTVYATSRARAAAKKAKRALASLSEQGVTASFPDPVAATRIIYGEVRVGGTTVFAHTNGVKNETLHMVIVHAGHDCAEMGEVYYGDEALGMPWNAGSPPNTPDVGSRFHADVLVNKKVVGGAADADLVSAAPTKWTTDHKLTGLASTYHRLNWEQDVFPQGASFNVSVLVKGKLCYDPRTATTAWTRNPALCLRDYLVSFMGVDTSEIDDADVIAAANVCDENVTIADATTQQRYTCNLVLETSDSPADNRRKLANCMSGWVGKIGGKWRMKAGAHQSSALSITMDDFRGPIQFFAQDEIDRSCNGIRAVYLDPQNNWQPADATPVIKVVTAPNITAGARCTILSVGTTDFTAIGAASNTVGVTFTATGAGTGTGTVDPYLGADNGVRRWRDIELYGCTNHPEAQRLMRIELERARHDMTISAPLKQRGMLVQAGDYVDITESRYGWTGKLFEVVRHKTIFEMQEKGVAIGTDLTLREVSSSIYDRTAADETTADPAPNTDMQRPWDIAAPTSLTLASGTDELLKLKDGTIIARLKVSWTAPADPYVTGGGRIEIQHKQSAMPDWVPVTFAAGDATAYWISPVFEGGQYDVRIRSVNPLGVTSDWVTATGHTVVGKTAAPNPVTGLTATALPGAVRLEWTPPADTDLKGHRIYEASTNVRPGSPSFYVAAPASSYTRDGLAGGVTRYYWVENIDTSDNLSSIPASVNATTTSASAGAGLFGLVVSASTMTDSGGGNVVKSGGTAGWGDAQAYSLESYTGGAFCSFQSPANNLTLAGLNTDPTTDADYPSVDYAWSPQADGIARIFASGTQVATGDAYDATTVFSITYDGATIRWFQNGVQKHSVAASAGLRLYFDSSLYGLGNEIRNIRFGPMGSVGSAGAAGYTIEQTMPNPQVRCDSAGTPLAGELTTPRVQTTFSVLKGTTALTGVTGTPTSGQFRVLANGSGVSSTATFSTAYIELDTVSADSGYIPYKVELEGTSVFVVGQWHWVKTLAGATGSTGPQGPTGSTGPTGPTGPQGLGFSATSSTSNTLGTGSKTWTLSPAAGAWAVGMRVRMSVVGSAYAEGQVTAYNSGTGSITISVDRVNGAGTYNSWFATAAGEVGATGPTGPTGDPGPGVVYRGTYSASTAYFHTTTRRDIVLYSGSYYLANNTGKSGLTTWGTPGGGDWVSFGATFSSVATAILLAEDATVIKTLVMGDGSTADGGIIRSAGATAFATGSGYWLNPRSSAHSNVAVFRVGAPGGYRISYDGTDVEVMSRRVIIGDSAGTNDTVGDLQIVGEVSNRKFGSGSQNTGWTTTVAQGTIASPSATASGSFAAMRLRGYDGGAYVTAATIRLKAQAAWTSGNTPTEMEFIVSSGAANNYVYITKDGRLKTGAPSGGTAGEWKLGTVASVSPTSPNRTIEVEIGGTTYYLHAKTTNN